MADLKTYIQQFANLRRANARHGHYSDATKKKAPHKPILLLAVIMVLRKPPALPV